MEVKDFGVPDTVKSMSWCGENICLGIRKEYMILNTTNGVLSEVFSSGKIAPPLVVALPSGELILGKVLIYFDNLFYDIVVPLVKGNAKCFYCCLLGKYWSICGSKWKASSS